MGRCFHSTVLDTPIAEVWSALRNFHNLSWGTGVVTSCVKVGDTPGDQAGAQRVLNSSFHETLRSLDDSNYTLTYTIDDGPEPISKDSIKSYVGTIRLREITDSSRTYCEWETVYETTNDDLVAGFCNPIYAALLEAMKAHFA